MKRAFPALLALLCATLALLIATSSSPLYAANFWTDTNIYFTIGRGMTRGLMPYRDLFDHKGPLLFMLYALGAAISDTSFIGVFILEALSLAAAVYAGWRTVSLFGEGRLTLLSMPILAAVVCCCTAFTQGGSAEEFALPALAAGVYLALALMVRPGEADGRRALGFGAAAGWVFLIKYTDIGGHIALRLESLPEYRYADFEELTPAMLRDLIEKIIVHEGDKSSGHREQRIEIYYTFISAAESLQIIVKHKKKAA